MAEHLARLDDRRSRAERERHAEVLRAEIRSLYGAQQQLDDARHRVEARWERRRSLFWRLVYAPLFVAVFLAGSPLPGMLLPFSMLLLPLSSWLEDRELAPLAAKHDATWPRIRELGQGVGALAEPEVRLWRAIRRAEQYAEPANDGTREDCDG